MLSRCNLPKYFRSKSLDSAHFPPPRVATHTTSRRCRQDKRVSFLRSDSRRPFTTSVQVLSRPSSQPNSLFSSNHSSWDHLFSEDPGSAQPPSRPRPRQAMTARESNAFNEMFEMIFDALAAQDSASNSSSTADSPVGIGRGGIDDLIGKLRKTPRRLNLSPQMSEVLDRQKEVVNLFATDQELLEWALDEVFGESQRYEEAARKAISGASQSGTQGELPMLQPPTYPHLVSILMQTFRERFNDPHLALAMFEHARNLSIASYVFGCSSQAYHELIETRWKCFQDLKGVHEALEEMKLNGVKVDRQTRQLVDKIRREVGERHLWVEESELGSGEIWNLLSKVEELAKPPAHRVVPTISKAKEKDTRWDAWKTQSLEDEEGDDWGFDRWDRVDSGPSQNGFRPQLAAVSRRRSNSFGLKE